MQQIDAFGPVLAEPKFKDIKNKREAVAERKAVLALELHEALRRVPMSVRNGSIQQVMHYQDRHKAATKTAKKPDASVRELEDAIADMKQFA